MSSRRDFLRGCFSPLRSLRAGIEVMEGRGPAPEAEPLTATVAGSQTAGSVPAASAAAGAGVAVVLGRHCLAYQKTFCSTCLERCPVKGALFRKDGLPMVNPELCNGCGLCVAPCPAPTPAIRLLPRRLKAPPPAHRPDQPGQ